MKTLTFIFILVNFLFFDCYPQNNISERFSFVYFEPEIRGLISQPSEIESNNPLELIIYALPNGNSIEQTFGKSTSDSLEWRYEIQHIGAQSKLLRKICSDKNIVVVYLETKDKSFPAWRKKHPESGKIIHSIVDSLCNIFAKFSPSVTLTGHSGGGSFIFGYLNHCKSIPSFIKRISFLDSNYGYSKEEGHLDKLIEWLNKDPKNFLSVIAYDDRNIELNGKKVLSPTGGTFRRTTEMKQHFAEVMKLNTRADSVLEISTSANNNIEIIIHTNPDNLILHTVLVERNGFLQAMLSGLNYSLPFTFWDRKAYSEYIDSDLKFY